MTASIVTITGPSCCGKSTLERFLACSPEFYRTVSVTTRPPRVGEVAGEHYHFATEEEFADLESSGSLFESVTFSGYQYGGLVSEMTSAWRADRVPVIVCEPHGLEQICVWSKSLGVEHVLVHFQPKPYMVHRFIQERLSADLSADALLNRMRSFIYEMEHWHKVVQERTATVSDLRRTIRVEQFLSMSDVLFVFDQIRTSLGLGGSKT